MGRLPKAVLFDSDGTLIDSEWEFFRITREVLRQKGFELRPETWARWYLGEGCDTLTVFERLHVPSSLAVALREERNRLFYGKIDQGLPPRPFILETLHWLENRVPMAIVTSSSRKHFERVHQSTGLVRFFKTIITSDDCPAPKPDPQSYHLALARLGFDAADCLAVEDSPRGARAARAAGLECVIVPTSLTDPALCPPDCTVLRDMSEFIPWLMGLFGFSSETTTCGRHEHA